MIKFNMPKARNCGKQVLLLLALGLIGPTIPAIKAQTYLENPGTPTFTTSLPIEKGFYNAANGNVHLEIPLGSFPQRGGNLAFALTYDSAMWTVPAGLTTWSPKNISGINNGPWRLISSVDSGSVNPIPTNETKCSSDGKYEFVTYQNFIWTAPDGSTHNFPITPATVQDLVTACTPNPGSGTPAGTGYANDSTGYYMSVTNYTQATVYAPNGNRVFPSYEDANGNFYSLSNGNIVDTLGRTPVTTTTNGSTITYTVLTPQGTSGGTYTVTTESIPVDTNFGQSGISECSSCSVTVIKSIALPDGTSYSFNYDSGTTAGHYGLLTSMTLPTGAMIDYTFQVFSDATSNKYEWLQKRTTPDGPWIYAQSVVGTPCGSGQIDCTQTNKITKPNGDTVLYTFVLNGGAWSGKVQYYSGSSSLLSTVNLCWNFVTVTNGQCTYNTQTGPASTGIQDSATSTVMPIPTGNLTKTTEYFYDSYGNAKQISEWNYYSTMPPNADRTTCSTYPLIGTNIVNHPTIVTVVNNWALPSSACSSPPAADIVAQTLYAYDGASLTLVAGTIPGHDTNFGTNYTTRGNLTQTQKLGSGSTYLNSSATYDTTGQALTSTDFNSNQTSYVYSGTYYNAYPTTVTNAASQSTTVAYDFNTGLVTSVTDTNSQPTSFAYDNMSRLLNATYANGGQDATTYTDVSPSFSVQLIRKITSSLNASTTSVLDSLGRQSSSTLNSDPDGATSVNTVYDSNGRVYTASNPHRTSSSPTDGLETYAYDGLDRQIANTHADNSVLQTFYGPNVTSAGGVGTQQGSTATYGFGYPALTLDEALNPRQAWTDGFGRTIEVDEPGATYTSPTPGKVSETVTGTEKSSTPQVPGSIGPRSPTSGTNVNGGQTLAWSNPGYITAKDSNSAGVGQVIGAAQTITSQWLEASNYGFSIPGNATITGVVVTVYKRTDYGVPTEVFDASVLLLKGGALTGNNEAKGSSPWPTTETAISYGASNDTWGLSLAPGDINASNFGVGLYVKLVNNDGVHTHVGDAAVDYISITVYYTTPGTTTYDSGTVSVTVTANGIPVQMSTTYGQGSTTTSVASGLVTNINGNNSSPVTALSSGATLTLTAKTVGVETDYSVTSSSTSSLPGTFNPPSFSVSVSNLSNGSNGGSFGSTPPATLYTYDLNNNLTGVVSAGGTQTRSNTYDLLSRVTSSTNPETGKTTFSYTTSANGLCSGNPLEVCLRTDARSITTTYTYDTLNRLTSKSYSDGTPTVNYYYDQTSFNGLSITNGKGRLTGMSDGSGQTAWSYDAMGNVLTETRTIAGVTETIAYTYNLDNSIATITYPSNRVVTYTPGGAQHPIAAQDTTNNINYAEASSLAMYAPTGAPLNILYGYAGSTFGGITETRAYNNRLGITSIQAISSTATALSLGFSYPTANNGNISTQTNNVDTGRTQNYQMDALNRLLSVQTNATSGIDCWGQSFVDDKLANFLSATSLQCSSFAPQYGVDANNHINSPSGYSYDAAGNSTADGQWTYTYDAENRIASASGMSGGPYCYTYDGNNMRVVKSNGTSCSSATVDVLYWRNSAGNTIAETDSTGSTTDANYHEYVFFAGRRITRSDPSSGIQYYYFVDQIGSTRSVAEVTPSNSPADGTVCFSVDYYPYGQEVDYNLTCPQNYKFTGYERDGETGLDYAFARYYNDRLGRFMSGDPLGGDGSDPQTLNRYSYVRNNPINASDPTGMLLYVGGGGGGFPSFYGFDILGGFGFGDDSGFPFFIDLNIVIPLGGGGGGSVPPRSSPPSAPTAPPSASAPPNPPSPPSASAPPNPPTSGETNGIPNGLPIPPLGFPGILLPNEPGCDFGGCGFANPPPVLLPSGMFWLYDWMEPLATLKRWKRWAVSQLCGTSEDEVVLQYMEFGAVKGTLYGAYEGATAGVPFAGVGAVPGAIGGAVVGGVVTTGGAALTGSAASKVCKAAGVYKKG